MVERGRGKLYPCSSYFENSFFFFSFLNLGTFLLEPFFILFEPIENLDGFLDSHPASFSLFCLSSHQWKRPRGSFWRKR